MMFLASTKLIIEVFALVSSSPVLSLFELSPHPVSRKPKHKIMANMLKMPAKNLFLLFFSYSISFLINIVAQNFKKTNRITWIIQH